MAKCFSDLAFDAIALTGLGHSLLGNGQTQPAIGHLFQRIYGTWLRLPARDRQQTKKPVTDGIGMTIEHSTKLLWMQQPGLACESVHERGPGRHGVRL